MKPDKATVYEIFQLEKRYVVPLYQRPYVWNEDDHWVPLWNDIETKAIATAANETTGAHFLGAIVLSQLKVGMRQIASSQVIDGQQRLTTLQVVLAVFRDIANELTSATADTDTRETLGTIYKMLSQITEHSNVLGAKEDRYKVWPTNADRSVYEDVMTARSRSALDTKHPVVVTGKRKKVTAPAPRLVEAYRFFDARIRDFLRDSGTNLPGGQKDAALGLFEAIRRCLQLVVIDLDEHDDPQVIFETLNARGEPLLPSDLIRNVVFNRAGKDADALYESHWSAYDVMQPNGVPGFWKTKIKQGREVRPVLDLFFHSFLSCKAERVIPLGHLFEEFGVWWRAQQARPISAVLDELRRYSDAYQTFHEPSRLGDVDAKLASFAMRLRILDTAMVYPVLLYLVVETAGHLPRDERDGILVDLESFLIRRWLCNITAKNYNRLFAALLHDLRAEPKLDRQGFRTRLGMGKGVDRWPDDKEFETTWLRDPVYERLSSSGLQMVLRAVHDALLTRRQEKVTVPSGLTVEHVMPQAWRNHWPSPAPLNGTPQDEAADERRDRLIHTFGNLTLLTTELNSAERDASFDQKRPAITRQSLLLLNAYFQEVEEWNEDAILLRGAALFEHAKKIWPHPGAAAR